MPQKSSRKGVRSPTPPASVPVIVVKANEFHFDTQIPCRLSFIIPLELPPLLDPSIPPPPYQPPQNSVGSRVLYDLTRTVLRPVVSGALLALLGSDAAVSEMVRASATTGGRGMNSYPGWCSQIRLRPGIRQLDGPVRRGEGRLGVTPPTPECGRLGRGSSRYSIAFRGVAVQALNGAPFK